MFATDNKHGRGLSESGGVFLQVELDLFKIDGVMNAENHRKILIHHAVPSGRRLVGPIFIFQHDNDPKQTAKKVKIIYKEKKIKDNFS